MQMARKPAQERLAEAGSGLRTRRPPGYDQLCPLGRSSLYEMRFRDRTPVT